MWIYQNERLESSGHKNVNFLFRENNIYIMDNHLSAAWCWISHLDINKTYNLFHIDRHYDLLHKPNAFKQAVSDKQVDLKKLSFEDFLKVSFKDKCNREIPLFLFDTYLCHVVLAYPNLISNVCQFATHDDGFIAEIFEEKIEGKPNVFSLETSLSYWINNCSNKNKWIVNLDIDYFFKDYYGDNYHQFLTDEYIKCICCELKKCYNKIAIITIALSPEFCGGWENSIRIAELISSQLGLKFKIDLTMK